MNGDDLPIVAQGYDMMETRWAQRLTTPGVARLG